MSLDGGMTGKWVEQVSQDYPKYTYWLQNILIDSCTDQYGQADWLTYITRLSSKQNKLWSINKPHAFNLNFPCVVWPDKTQTTIPKNSVFQWIDW
jgi:hypothetical protein